MNNIELNKKANEEFSNLTEHGFFDEIEVISQQIKNCKNRFEVGFYLEMQDKLTYVSGEINNSYIVLLAELESYIVIRKQQVVLESYKYKGEFTVNGEKTKITSTLLNSVLSSLIRGEVADLYKVNIILEGKLKHIMNMIQTCRSHLYTKEIKRED